jgi:threonine/homoserine/homoserine lactone efflux protein
MNSDFHVLVYLLSTAVLLLAPGPTNTLLAAAGLERGWRGAFSLIACALAGYLMAISGWGILITSMENSYPWLSTTVRVACSAYLLYVAAKIWMSTKNPSISGPRAIGPATVFMTTLLNPKGLLFASTIFPPQAFDDLQVYVMTTALFACLVVPIGVVWVSLGTVVGSGRVVSLNPLKLQRALAVVIVVFSATLVWTAIH